MIRVFSLAAALIAALTATASGQTSDYGDFAAFPGASSTVNPGLLLGATVDADAETPIVDPLTGLTTGVKAPSDAAATADDTAGTDDEDGVTIPAVFIQGGTVTIPVVVLNTTGADAYLNAWFDIDNNSRLDDFLITAGGEKLSAEIVIPGGTAPVTQSITFTLPVNAGTGTGRGLRFRLTSVSNPGPDGADGDGEIEDYIVQVKPSGYIYGVSGGSIYQINASTGQAVLATDLDPSITSMGNALAFDVTRGTAGILIYSTGAFGDLRLGVWDRATGAGNVAGDLRSFGMPAANVLRSGAGYAGFYWAILDDSDDLWKISFSGTSGNYRIASALKVCDLWSNARAHSFGDMVIRPDGTMLALGENSATGQTEFFTANLTSVVPVASFLGYPPIFQNGIALGVNGRLLRRAGDECRQQQLVRTESGKRWHSQHRDHRQH